MQRLYNEPLNATDGTYQEAQPKRSRLHTVLLILACLLLGATLFFAIRANLRMNNIEPGRRYPHPDIDNLLPIWEVHESFVKYYEHGAYDNDLSKISIDARKKVLDNLPKAQKDKPHMIVFDIDETLINHYPHYKSTSYVWVPEKWDKWVEEAIAPPLQPVIDILRQGLAKDVKIALITGRTEDQRAKTIENLTFAGIAPEDYDFLILRSEDEHGKSAATYKAHHRKVLSETHEIVMCVGDQYSDCQGGYEGLAVKLPNFVYFIA